jgi:hypothetical protein
VKRYIIEREIPDVDRLNAAELRDAANKSNAALAQLAPRVQWLESFVTKGKTFCVYLAEDEAAVQEHARLSGFPANTVSQVFRIIDPATAA